MDNSFSSIHPEPLINAIVFKNVQLVLNMITHGAFINEPDRFGFRPIHYALFGYNKECSNILYALVLHGAYLDQELINSFIRIKDDPDLADF